MFGWMAVVATVALLVGYSTWDLLEPVSHTVAFVAATMAVVLLAICASYRGLAVYIRAEDRREAEIADAARLEGVSLAADTLRHQVGNKLAVAAGYSELLAEDPRVPPELRQQANKVLTSAMAAAAVVQQLDAEMVRMELDRTVAGPKVLDVDGSIRLDDQQETPGPLAAISGASN